MSAGVRILICDDHALVRSGLRRLLEDEDGFEVAGEAASADEAIKRLRDDQPDVLLLDVGMPGRSGIEALPEIVATAPGTKVLMLSMQDDPAYVRRAFSAGADGYLLKDAADAELVKALHEVTDGHQYVHPSLGARLAEDNPVAQPEPPLDGLSDREHEVLRLLALGHTNLEIANMLSLSVRTVETYRARISQKLGLKSRAEIVRFVIASGEFPVPSVSQSS
jgi:DNA-binding NarL/FixJ family response regulator